MFTVRQKIQALSARGCAIAPAWKSERRAIIKKIGIRQYNRRSKAARREARGG